MPMKNLPTCTLLFLLCFGSSAGPVVAENYEDLNQLLATKKCPLCDLSGAGLVMANLRGANLVGANLSGANLNQANLSGANLSGANLTHTALNGANLTGANLSGAILNNTDLRGAYLHQVNFTAVNLSKAYVQGAMGMPQEAGTPELFYGWGLLETRKGNYRSALTNYNKALGLDPDFAPGYLGRGLAYLRLGDEQTAQQNVEYAAILFKAQENQAGYETAQGFLKNLQEMEAARNQGAGTPQLDAIVRGVASLALQFLLK